MKIPGIKYLNSYIERYKSNVILSRLGGILGIDILVKASAFLLIPFYLQFMSQAEFGLYNYLITIVQTLSLILNLGLYIPITKYYHSHPDPGNRGSLLFTVFTTLSVFIIVLLVPVYFLELDYPLINVLFSSDMDYGSYRPLIFLALFVTTLNFTLNSYLFTSEKILQIKLYNIGRIVFVNILSIVAIAVTSADTVKVRLQYTFIAELVLMVIFGYPLIKEMIPRYSRIRIRNSLKMGLPIMLSACFGIIINFGDKFFLEKYGTLEDLSNYYLAFSFASIIPLVFTSFQNVWLPVFMKEKNVELNYEKTIRMITRLCFAFIALGFLMWSGLHALLWLKIIPVKYFQVSSILPILLVSQMVASISTLFSNYLIYFEKTQIVTITGVFVSICSLTAALLLIPGLNVYGAALTALISNLLYLTIYYCMAVYLKKKHLEEAPLN